MKQRLEAIPILPLTDALLFPKMVLPLYVMETRFQQMIIDAKDKTGRIGIVYQRPGTDEVPKVGTICCIGKITYSEEVEQNIMEEVAENLPDEGKPLILTGKERAEIHEIVQTEPYVIARVARIKETVKDKKFYKECSNILSELLLRFLFLKHVSDKEIHLANLLTLPAHIADFVAFYFINELHEKQQYLEMTDVSARCKQIAKVLQGAITELQEQQQKPPNKSS
jgi:ATP-dependent Lon protease